MTEKTSELKCPLCNSSSINKSGKRYNLHNITQKYKCKRCGTSFTNSGYFRSRFPLEVRQHVITLYAQGLSLRKIQEELERIGIFVSHVAIDRWLQKMNIERRRQSCGNHKNITIREHIELGITTSIRFSSSIIPEKINILQNLVITLN